MATKRNAESQRAPNFSSLDVEILIQLVKKYKNILECKKSDAVTWKEKNNAWEHISKEMLELTGISRTTKTLRDKYKNLKTDSKKKFAEEKCETFKTGGGKFVPVEITDIDIQLKELCGMSMTGLSNTFDSDSSCVQNNSGDHENELENIYIEIEEETSSLENNCTDKPDTVNNSETDTGQNSTQENVPEINWKTWNPSMLKTPKSAELNVSNVIVTKGQNSTQENASEINWKTWNPNMLKTPKSAELNVTVTKDNSGTNWHTTPKKKKTVLTEDCRIKINILSEAKLELTKLLIQCTKEENERKKQEHDLHMRHQRDLNCIMIEQKKLELQLLKRKLENCDL